MIHRCVLCQEPLTLQNDSREHVIPNSIGGRQKISGFLCLRCNNGRGADWDSELAKQFHGLALLTGVKRDRGETPNRIVRTISGESFLQRRSAPLLLEKPIINIRETEQHFEISISARSLAEAKRVALGLSRKYPKISVDELAASATLTEEYLKEPIHDRISFGGPLGGRSMVKTAIAFAAKSGIDASSCEKALEYLLRKDAPPSYGWYYDEELVESRSEAEICHRLILYGLAESRRLVCYVEYFEWARILVNLSSKYNGPSISIGYSIDVTTGLENGLSFIQTISEDSIRKSLRLDEFPLKATEALQRAIEKIQRRNFDVERERVVKAAFLSAGKELGFKEGQDIPPEKAKKLTELMVAYLGPFITHMLSRPTWSNSESARRGEAYQKQRRAGSQHSDDTGPEKKKG